jgi:hypothetical protein
VGDAVLCVVGLVSPLCFGGDYRPYFSLYDPDFREVSGYKASLLCEWLIVLHASALSDCWKGCRILPLPPPPHPHTRAVRKPRIFSSSLFRFPAVSWCHLVTVLSSVKISDAQERSAEKCVNSALFIGTTNPFFVKCFENWPNCLWMCAPTPATGTPAAESPSSPSTSSVHTVSGLGSPGRSAAGGPLRVKPRVITRSTPLTAVFPSPGQEHKLQLMSVCRAEPLVPADTTVLSQLLSIREEDELGMCEMFAKDCRSLVPAYLFPFSGSSCCHPLCVFFA